MTALTRPQLAVLHVAQQRLGLPEEEYRDVLESCAGVRSAKELDAVGFRAVMERFEVLGFESRARSCRARVQRAKGRPAPQGLVTEAQQEFIGGLYRRLGLTLRRQRGFNRRVCGVSWPQTRRDASKVIEALKCMAERGWDANASRFSQEDDP